MSETRSAGARSAKSIMMSAHALSPHGLSHPERMQWLADYFIAHHSPAQPGEPIVTVRGDMARLLATFLEARASIMAQPLTERSEGDTDEIDRDIGHLIATYSEVQVGTALPAGASSDG